MLSLAIFDMPTRSSSGFVYRSILTQLLRHNLYVPFARNPFFSHFINNSDFVLATGHGQNNEMTWAGRAKPMGKRDNTIQNRLKIKL